MFTFQQFTISDSRCAMKVGTDGVLLGAWAPVPSTGWLLDMGCGSGLIALMLAQRSKGGRVVGVELDCEAALEAAANAAASPFADRVEIVRADVVRWAEDYGRAFDAIVCNPPYHEEELLPPDRRRAAARHTAGGGLTFAALIRAAERLLSPGEDARFSVVLPTPAVAGFVGLAAAYGLTLVRRTDVVTRPQKPAKRSLLSFGRSSGSQEANSSECQGQAGSMTEPLVLVGPDGGRSEAYEALCADFYLKKP